jgi:DNA mismatch repair protein MutS
LTLFATHYFELTSLPEHFPSVANLHLTATEHEEHIVFLYAVKEGPTSQSYGLQVAALAGVPQEVIAQARQRLLELENHTQHRPADESEVRPGLLEAPADHQPIIEMLQNLDPDELSPQQALKALYELKQLLTVAATN